MNNNTKKKIISVILPILNEEQVILDFINELVKIIKKENFKYEILAIDDNSVDNTFEILKKLNSKNKNIKIIQMSKRFGDQSCIMAGFKYCKGDCAIVMDSDFQHPPKYLPKMIQSWLEGNQTILMIRKEQGHDNFFKKYSEIYFYKFLSFLSNTTIYNRFSGFCLIDRKVIEALNNHLESSPFVRGLISSLGFKIKTLKYVESVRLRGETKYNLSKMFNLAMDGIFNFSYKPLYLSLYIGLIIVFSTFLYGLIILTQYFFFELKTDGWASLMLAIIFFGGCQLIFIGIQGIYISRIFQQVKKRPNYIIKDKIGIISK